MADRPPNPYRNPWPHGVDPIACEQQAGTEVNRYGDSLTAAVCQTATPEHFAGCESTSVCLDWIALHGETVGADVAADAAAWIPPDGALTVELAALVAHVREALRIGSEAVRVRQLDYWTNERAKWQAQNANVRGRR